MKKVVRPVLAVTLALLLPLLAWAGGQKEGAAASSTSASAGPTKIVLWDFLSGGDGVRWTQILNDFNASQDKLVVDHTTLTWGDPFYTKVHTAVVAGQTPDVMTYHLSHFPAGILAGDLRPFTEAELQTVGLSYNDFNPVLVKRSLEISKAYGTAGDLYGVPLDAHTFVLYYNKDLLNQAGLLGSDGTPLAAITGVDNFTAALQKLKAITGTPPLGMSSANDPASVWRMWYTLFEQLGGGELAHNGKLQLGNLDTAGVKALQTMVSWAQQGLLTPNISYAADVSLFLSGKTAFMANGNWEVPTMVDAQKKGTLTFGYGVMAFPQLFSNRDTWADSHNISIPNNTKNPISPAMLHNVLTLIAYIEHHAIIWAGGGHLPAYLPVLDGSELAHMVPNDEYSVQAAKDATFEPISPVFGVGDPAYDAVGNFLTPALTGQLSVQDAIAKFKAQLESYAQ